ncbi:MAG: hypothetical protein EPO32_14900 [Anaerolineae bacterium]|nr:MAG: hypothetical protein EPO32_14900 [Anaerolineae bacterium]
MPQQQAGILPETQAGLEAFGVPPAAGPAAEAPPEQAAAEAPPAPIPLGNGRNAYRTPAGLVVYEKPRAGTKGGLQETSRTIKGGMEPSEDFIEQQNELEVDARLANQQAYEAETKRLAFEKGAAEAQQVALAKQSQEAEATARQAAADAADREARYDAAIQDFHASKVDPDQLQKENGFQFGSASILAGIASALGDKTAVGMLESQIDRNIKAQETAIAIKRDKAGNLLHDLERKLGSRDDAKTALKQIRLEQSINAMQIATASAKDDETRAKYAAVDAGLREKLVNLTEEYRQKTLGETTRNLTFKPGQSGSAGGPRLATIEEESKVLDLDNKRVEHAGKVVSVQAAQKKLGEGPSTKMSSRQKVLINAADTADAGLQSMLAEQDAAGDPLVIRTGVGATDYSQNVGRKAAILAPTIAAATGMKPDDVKDMLTATKASDRQANIEQIRKLMKDRKQAISDNPGGTGSTGGESESGTE